MGITHIPLCNNIRKYCKLEPQNACECKYKHKKCLKRLKILKTKLFKE